MAEIPVTKMGLVKKYGADIGSFIWKHFKEGTGFGELHPTQVGKQVSKLAAKAKKLQDKADHAKGPGKISVLPRFTSPKKEATEHILDPKTGKKVVKKTSSEVTLSARINIPGFTDIGFRGLGYTLIYDPDTFSGTLHGPAAGRKLSHFGSNSTISPFIFEQIEHISR